MTYLRSYTRRGFLVREVIITSHTYRSRPVRIFAYLVRPARPGSYPALVAIHGGGGYAMLSRGIEAARNGFVALVPDLPGKGPGRSRSRSTGPDMTVRQIFSPDPDENYLLHSVRALDSCIDVLTRLPYVNNQRVFLWGISWGAVVASLTAARNEAVKGCALLFGAGHITEESIWLGHLRRMAPRDVERWRAMADPAACLHRLRCPVFAITGTNDSCFPLPAFVATWTAPRSDWLMLLRPGLNHRIDGIGRQVMWRWLRLQAHSAPLRVGGVALRSVPIGVTPAIRLRLSGPWLPRRVTVWWTDATVHWHKVRWRKVNVPPTAADVSAVLLPIHRGEVFAFCETQWPGGMVTTSPVYTFTKVKFGSRHRWLAVWGIRQNCHVVPRGWLAAALGLKPRPVLRTTSLCVPTEELIPIREAARECGAAVRRLRDGTLEVIPATPAPMMALSPTTPEPRLAPPR